MKPTKNSKRTLLVEGNNDKHVILALLKHYAVPEAFVLEELQGIDNRIQNIRYRIHAFRESTALERLGIIFDADESGERRWERLRKDLIPLSVNIPEKPDPSGTVVVINSQQRLGIWVMPDNCLPGKLEDFLGFLVKENDSLLPRVDQFLQSLPTREECPARYPDKDLVKARIHGWLAIQEEPGKPMGQAITAKYLDANAPMANVFVDWIRRLFVDE